AIVKNIMSNARNLTVDASLVPRCTVCAGPMKMYLRIDGTFVQDEAWDKANDLYALFISRFGGSKLVILEIGVGYNTPSIIRYPFQALAAYAERSTLIRINREHPEVPGKLEDRAISFNDDAKIVIDSVYNRLMA
ncbi:MAG: hypothetical protein K2H64_13035, partial [Desulfovibrio sp.]|nr:hypothetical protein [Desulfovibrio sp.]